LIIIRIENKCSRLYIYINITLLLSIKFVLSCSPRRRLVAHRSHVYLIGLYAVKAACWPFGPYCPG
jgi:hypothetical protein